MKLIKYILACILVLVFALPVNATTSNAKPDIQKIMNLGFNDDEIATMSEKDKAYYSKLDGSVIEQKTKYYKFSTDASGNRQVSEVTKAEAIKGAEISNAKALEKIQDGVTANRWDNVTTCSWLTMTTTVSQLSGTKHYLFKNSFYWLSDPWIFLKDVVGLTHASSISFTSGTEKMYYTYDRYYQSTNQKKDYKSVYYSANKKSIAGYAWKYDLQWRDSQDLYWYRNHRGYATVEGYATPSNFVGYSNAFGHYTHQELSASLSIGLTPGSMTVSPSWAVDEAPDTDVQFPIYAQ